MNFDKPTPIQAATIPIALLGRDICACAVTGSGIYFHNHSQGEEISVTELQSRPQLSRAITF